MNSCKAFDRLNFDNYSFVYKQIQSITAIKFYFLVKSMAEGFPVVYHIRAVVSS